MILWITVGMSKHRYLSFGAIVGLWPGSMLLAFATLGITAGSAGENPSPTAVSQSPSSASALVRVVLITAWKTFLVEEEED